jgi:hypothetical protein
MPITLQCKNGHKLRVKDSAAGKKVRCPTCEDVILIAKSEETETLQNDVDFEDVDPDQMRSPKGTKRSIRPSKLAGAKSRGGQNKKSRFVVPLIGAAVVFGGIGVWALLRTRNPATDLAGAATQPISTTSPVATSSATPAPVTTSPASVVSNPGLQNTPPADPSSKRDSTITPSKSAGSKSAVSKSGEALTTALTAQAKTPKKELDLKAKNSATPAPLPTKVAAAAAVLQVWDAAAADPTAKSQQSLTRRGESWIPVGPADIATHEFRGDCVITNGKLWLHIPRDQSKPMKMAAKDDDSSEAVIPINILGPQSKADGPRVSRVTELSSDSALVTSGVEAGGPKFACRITKGKYWIEVIPNAGAEQLTIGIKAKFVVLPTEFGEDQICDAEDAVQKQISSVPVPHENMVVALERDGNHMSILTYPSIKQAGELTLGFDGPEDDANRGSNAIAKSLSAKLGGQSVFVCLLPQKNLWYSQVVTKKYSAPGHIPITDKSLYPGIWRIAGRVIGKAGPAYYVSEFPNTNLLFECRQSGTCECLFYFLSRPLKGSAGGVLTPLDMYRETVGQNKLNAYLLETETAGRLYHRTTKYRGVCGCMDDMIDKWKLSPRTLTEDAGYFSTLFADCKVIMEHMDIRLHEYQRMGQHLGEVLDKIKTKDISKGDRAAQEFLTAARRCYGGLTTPKLVDANRGYRMMGGMEKKIQAASKTKLNLVDLEKQMERARDVAGDEEIQLKKFRGFVMNLSEAASNYREKAGEPLKEYVTIIGRDCRKMLRTRGRAE